MIGNDFTKKFCKRANYSQKQKLMKGQFYKIILQHQNCMLDDFDETVTEVYIEHKQRLFLTRCRNQTINKFLFLGDQT